MGVARFRGRLTPRRPRDTVAELTTELRQFEIDTLESLIRIGKQRAADRESFHTGHVLARQLTITDDHGNVVAMLAPDGDAGQLTVCDQHGTTTATLSINDGKPRLTLADAAGRVHTVGR